MIINTNIFLNHYYMVTQSVIFDKEIWDTTRARRWLNKNKLYPLKRVHETTRYYRYRIRNPDYEKYEYRIKVLSNGIKAVIGFLPYQLYE